MIRSEPSARSYAVSLAESRGRWFAIGAVLTALLSVPTQVLFERGLGVDDFARWVLVNALVTFVMPLATLGSVNLVVSEFFEGRLNQRSGRMALVRYFAWCTALATIAFGAIYGFAPLAGAPTNAQVALATIVVVARSPVVLVYPLFQIHHHARLVAFWPAVENLGRFLLAVFSLVFAMQFTDALMGWAVLTAGLAVVGLLYPGLFRFPPISPPAARPGSEDESAAARGIRFGVAEYLDSLDLKLAIPFAALFLSTKEVAAAGLGLLFLNASHFFPYALVSRFLLPAIHSRAETDREAVHRTLVRWMLIGSVVTTVAGLLFALVGEDVVALLAKGDYSDQRFLFPMVGITMIPLCISILMAGRFLRIEHSRDLMTWRIQSTLAFLLVTLGAVQLGAVAPMLGIFISRAYLVARFLMASRRLSDADDSEAMNSEIAAELDRTAG